MLHALILACASGTTTTPPLAPTPEPPPTQQATPAALSSVEYHFQDASVPPPYHRSITIRVSLDSVDYVIDSYGDVVAEAHAPGSQATLDQAIAAYQAAGFALLPPSTEPECTGGTSQSVKVKQGKPDRLLRYPVRLWRQRDRSDRRHEGLCPGHQSLGSRTHGPQPVTL